MLSYRFAAIDIGSNAVRLLISNVFEHNGKLTFKKQSLVRVPLRLGEEAFLKQRFSDSKVNDFLEAMLAFKHLLNFYKPVAIRALATSAFREAENGPEVVDLVFRKTGIRIEVISGREEAEVVYANGLRDNMDADKSYLYMDVGGGSTELTLFMNHEAVLAKSFNVGSIRLLTDQVDSAVWQEMKEWVRKVQEKVPNELFIIGSGGNINKYCKLLNREYGQPLYFHEIDELYQRLKSMTSDERIQNLYLNPDRADVIVPAGKIFTSIMRWSGAKVAYVPKIGVSDGVIKMLYSQHVEELQESS